MTTKERIDAVNRLRTLAAGALMTERGFELFDLLLCGHTTPQQQEEFIKDAQARGLLK